MDKSGLITFTSQHNLLRKNQLTATCEVMCVKTNRSQIFFLLRGRLLTYGKKYLAFFNFLTPFNPRDYYICTLCKFRIPLIFRDFFCCGDVARSHLYDLAQCALGLLTVFVLLWCQSATTKSQFTHSKTTILLLKEKKSSNQNKYSMIFIFHQYKIISDEMKG